MKNNSQKEQNEKKKAALNEYLDALKEVDYWANKVENMEKSNGYRSPDATAAPINGKVGNPTTSAVLERETSQSFSVSEGGLSSPSSSVPVYVLLNVRFTVFPISPLPTSNVRLSAAASPFTDSFAAQSYPSTA